MLLTRADNLNLRRRSVESSAERVHATTAGCCSRAAPPRLAATTWNIISTGWRDPLTQPSPQNVHNHEFVSQAPCPANRRDSLCAAATLNLSNCYRILEPNLPLYLQFSFVSRFEFEGNWIGMWSICMRCVYNIIIRLLFQSNAQFKAKKKKPEKEFEKGSYLSNF